MGLKAERISGATNGDREDYDFYPTPPHATAALLKREKFIGTIWEPACGDGAMSKVLEKAGYQVYSSDIVDRGYGVKEEFLMSDKQFDNVITNPPFVLAEEFVRKAVGMGCHKVAMLCKLAFLESSRRYDLFRTTPLKTVYVFSKRVNFYKGTLEGDGSGLLAYAWYVWERGYIGRPQIEWINDSDEMQNGLFSEEM